MPTYKNPVTSKTVSVDESQASPYTNAGWTKTEDVSNPNFNSITPENLKPVSSINISPSPEDNTNYQGIINGGVENANAILKSVNKPAIAEEKKQTIEEMLGGLINSPAPSSSASLYEQTYGVGPTQEELSIKQEAERKAQQDLDLLNAQMTSLNAEAKAAPIKTQEEFSGRGATAGGVAPIDTAKLRNIALRALPLEGEILAKQAILTGSQKALQLAQSKFDKVFELRMSDITNQYNYKKDQQDKIWNYLTTKEQNQLDEIRRQDDRKYQESRDNLNLAQNLSKDAMSVGLADVSAQLTQLNPNSPTFIQDLANLQAQIVDKQTQLQGQATQDELAKSGYNYVATPAERDKLKSQGYEILVQGGRVYAKKPEMTELELYEEKKRIDRKYEKQTGGLDKNKLLSIDEAKTLKVPYGTTIGQAVDMGIVPESAIKAPTIAQLTASGYADRANDSNSVISKLGSKFTGTSSYLGQILPNTMKSSERQQYEQAERNFVNSILRRESGAVISDSEFENASLQYFPQPGDGQEVIKQKEANRKRTITNLMREGGASEEYPAGTIVEVDGITYKSLGNNQFEEVK